MVKNAETKFVRRSSRLNSISEFPTERVKGVKSEITFNKPVTKASKCLKTEFKPSPFCNSKFDFRVIAAAITFEADKKEVRQSK